MAYEANIKRTGVTKVKFLTYNPPEEKTVKLRKKIIIGIRRIEAFLNSFIEYNIIPKIVKKAIGGVRLNQYI